MSLALTISTILIMFITIVISAATYIIPVFLTTITNNCCNLRITETTPVYAQPSASKTQTWIDKQNNIKIQFASQPENPIVDKPTELKFSVQNLKTGDYLKNLLARVVVTNGQRSFKFTNITIPNGNFSVKYLFPDTGTYQVIGRIDENKNYRSSTLSSFQVFVSLQISGGNIHIIAIIATLIIIAIVFVIAIFIRRKKKKEKEHGLH
jgi:flagellar basal body-associated protein FliL